MSERKRWDDRHRASEFLGAPAPFLEAVLPHIPRGRALDVASGLGANALYLAERGFEVETIDWSLEALRKLGAAARHRSAAVHPLVADVTRYPLPSRRYDAVICFRFLERALWPKLVEALRPGGALVVETFTLSELEHRPHFPRQYCLGEGELLRVFASTVRVARYEELPGAPTAALLGFRASTEAPREAAPGS
jgi:tellurite methyltransferase